MINLSQETEALAHRLAVAQGVSLDAAIRLALEEKARASGLAAPQPLRTRDRSAEAVAARRARTDKLVAVLAAMPVLDPRSPHEIMDELNALG